MDADLILVMDKGRICQMGKHEDLMQQDGIYKQIFLFKPASDELEKEMPVSAEYYEEEEFKTQFSGKTLRRIVGLTRPHIRWVIGFLITVLIVSAMDSIFTYLSKQIIDLGIIARDKPMLFRLLATYGGLTLIQAVCVFGFIYLARRTGRTGAL